jgi:hypothetical protein
MVIQTGGTSVGGQAGTSSTAEIAIPPLSNTNNPKWVYIAVIGNDGMGSGLSLLFGQTGMGAATMTNGIGVAGWGQGVIINVAGNTHYRVISEGSTIEYTMTPLAGIVPGG